MTRVSAIDPWPGGRFSMTAGPRATDLTNLRTAVRLLAVLALLLSTGPVRASDTPVRRDTDKDGRIDQVAHLDENGHIAVLEIDTDADGIMDRFQYYRNGQVVRMERDRDADGVIDTRDVFEHGKRRRHQRFPTASDPVGQIIDFDDLERPANIRKDTTGDGRFDVVRVCQNGRVVSSTRDTDGDGRPNVWETLGDGSIRIRETDADGNGAREKRIVYDPDGRPVERFPRSGRRRPYGGGAHLSSRQTGRGEKGREPGRAVRGPDTICSGCSRASTKRYQQ